MNSRPLIFLGTIIIALALFAALGYLVTNHGRQAVSDSSTVDYNGGLSTVLASTSPAFYQSTSTADSTVESGGLNAAAVGIPSTLVVPFPASTTMDTVSWLIYVNNPSRYSIEYPPNLILGNDAGALTLAFPKNIYFHWPLLDDVKITVTVAPSCPGLISGGHGNQTPVQFTLNGYKFTRSVSDDVGAGQRYQEVAYDTRANGSCYHIDLLDHGTNGASFYVDDHSLIKKYDAAHDADMALTWAVLNTIVSHLRILAPAH